MPPRLGQAIARVKDLTGKMKDLNIALVTTETVAAGQCLALPEGETQFKAELFSRSCASPEMGFHRR